MRIVSNIQDLPVVMDSCLTIGNFDGVHKGHAALIDEAKKIAADNNLDFILLTFTPHPRQILKGAHAHFPLMTRDEKMARLEALGVRKIVELPFKKDLAALSAEDFIKSFLAPLRMRYLVMGHDFSMGKNREGDLALLRQLGQKYNFEITRVPAIKSGDHIISSTSLRQNISAGNVDIAAKLMGRPYAIEGIVGHGFARGRTMGFPTANLTHVETLLPGHGVYATYAICGGKRMAAITNIGDNPTFDGSETTIETFFLDTNADVYGSGLRLEFAQKIRGEIKFPNPQALAAQIGKDIDAARAILQV